MAAKGLEPLRRPPRPTRTARRGYAAAAAALALFAGSLAPPPSRAGEGASGLGFLVERLPVEGLGPEARAAWELARRLAGDKAEAVALAPDSAPDGRDGAGGLAARIGRFRVLWIHQGDSPELPAALLEAPAVQALRGFAAGGGGLFLSGAALALVEPLGLEDLRPRTGAGGSDDYVAAILPAAPGHPVLEGLAPGGCADPAAVPLSDRGFPAFADFHGTGGPLGGRLLARARSGDENPLAEYCLGKGRAIVLGWRLPHYANASNAHRRNLERLTANILGYLADPGRWQEMPAPSRAPRPSGVPDAAWESLELAVRDLGTTFGPEYPRGAEHLAALEGLRKEHEAALREDDAARLRGIAARFEDLKAAALLENPLLRFEKLLLVERGEGNLGLPANWDGNSGIPRTGYENRLCLLSPPRPDGKLETLFLPEGGRFAGDVDLHFDADRLLFSMPGSHDRWQVFELKIDGTGLRELPLIAEPDVDNFDACYLPDGRIVFTSTATFAGVPCVYGSSHVTNLYLLERDGSTPSIRQLTVDQDHNWCPAVANDGRVLYLRWEYADLPHASSRILFAMNPDGTGQAEVYGSSSYFPNSFFYARPVPGHPTKVAGIATGHHGTARSGRLLILDPAKGRREAEGVVQEVPGRGKRVEATVRDNLVDGVWPQLLHPFPLSEKHFLVSARPSPRSRWGIYLADVFDNLVLLKESPGRALLEPVPVARRPRPPEVRDRVELSRDDALVYAGDVYSGGLEGIPRGEVKALRLFTYEYSLRGMGGLLGSIGMDGPWDVRRILGTVPVEPDGSAFFRVPAMTPVAVQPLDAEGKAVQLMRSWFTAMPGEVVSCAGCHEGHSRAASNRATLAARRAPAEIEPWRGPARGFSFAREVQPVLDRRCVRCHDGRERPGEPPRCDLRGEEIVRDWTSAIDGHVSPEVGGKFSTAYVELHRFVRRPGIESDIHRLSPMEFHADATELVQVLAKGHHGVELDREAWDRIVTWIDLNAPYHGSWAEVAGEDRVRPVAERYRTMRRRYARRSESLEAPPAAAAAGEGPVAAPPDAPAPSPDHPEPPGPRAAKATPPAAAPGWPFGAGEARRRQREDGGAWRRSIDLGGGVALELVRVPAGELLLGDAAGEPDEGPPCRVRIDEPFWIGATEVTNEQYALHDPLHDSHVEPMHGYQFGVHGYPVDGPRQPVVRVSWREALEFCEWLSARTGLRVTLPSEAQWEHACRAGTATPFWFGGLDDDFSRAANLGDARLRELALDTYVTVRLVKSPNRYDDWVPKESRFDDGALVSLDVGRYEPNPWGLRDAHGNVWEWTRSAYRPYPYRGDDGREDLSSAEKRVVRGGSWYDRPKRCRSASRLAYRPYQRVFNVGFRVAVEGMP
ncbi:MAG: SUMF1/EgtB/PvdO family nonheme iron enzyme [Planctomycetes bacterium]|nr:SUMF1/EgtB/PvdO family nonheme iron enzyme [Planctomycetota bacterium]